MICIFSFTRDQTTTDVIRWLHHLGHSDVLRINSDASSDIDPPIEIGADQDSLYFRLNNRTVSLSDIKSAWYRKGSHWLCRQFLNIDFPEHPALTNYLRQRIDKEQLRLSEYFHYLIETTVPTLGSPSSNDPNKLIVLHAAIRAGLLVPSFQVCNSRDVLLETVTKTPCITKALSDIVYLFDKKTSHTGYYSYTEEVEAAALQELPERLSPSLIQDQISKRYDVRVFYLAGECYAMAIVSQLDEQTRVDFRRYNYHKPNRTVPLRLSPDLVAKIRRLFEDLSMNTGSVDFVVDEAGRFFFLEINPVGQFAQVSNGCNYHLEKRVAVTLEAYARHSQTSIARQ